MIWAAFHSRLTLMFLPRKVEHFARDEAYEGLCTPLLTYRARSPVPENLLHPSGSGEEEIKVLNVE
jgi:hypothetical protein